MDSALAALNDTPIPTILVIAGIVFSLLAVAGQLAARIAVVPERQRWAAVIGSLLLVIGVALHVLPQGKLSSPGTMEVPTSQPSHPLTTAQPPPSSGGPPTLPPPHESPVPASAEEKEPNDAARVQPASLAFESNPSSVYAIRVDPISGSERGDDELAVRKE